MHIQQTSAAGGAIAVTFIQQEGQAAHQERTFTNAQMHQAAAVAGVLADFIKAAKSSLHMAIYDFRLDGEAADAVIGALNQAAQAGIDVRIAYFEAKNQPKPDAFSLLGSDPAVINDGLGGARFHGAVKTKGIVPDEDIGKLVPPVEGEAITAPHNLMHSKYVVRDGMTKDAAVLMGSANFTTDAWAVQDNNIVVFQNCQELSAYYQNDFSEMWQSGKISNSGNFDTTETEIGGVSVQAMFAPGRGRQIGTDIAALIDSAQDRLLLSSMVISSGPILGAIADRMHRVSDFAGIYDGPEMRMVLSEWSRSKRQEDDDGGTASKRKAASSAKAQQFEEIANFLHYKKSLPFKAEGVHNFMHNKFAVIDDTVVTGSFNFSTNAQNNAENVVVIRSKELADAYAGYLARLLKAYPDTGVPAASHSRG